MRPDVRHRGARAARVIACAFFVILACLTAPARARADVGCPGINILYPDPNQIISKDEPAYILAEFEDRYHEPPPGATAHVFAVRHADGLRIDLGPAAIYAYVDGIEYGDGLLDRDWTLSGVPPGDYTIEFEYSAGGRCHPVTDEVDVAIRAAATLQNVGISCRNTVEGREVTVTANVSDDQGDPVTYFAWLAGDESSPEWIYGANQFVHLYKPWVEEPGLVMIAWGNTASRTHALWQVDLTACTLAAPAARRKAIAVDGGSAHSLALMEDGRIYAWGANHKGQLGNNAPSQTPTKTPVRVRGHFLTHKAALISAGADHNLAVDLDGRGLRWVLGTPDGTETKRPGQVQNLNLGNSGGNRKLAAGSWHTLALDRDGQVWAWGSNSHGQLGIGNGQGRTPQKVLGQNGQGFLAGVTAIAADAGSGTGFGGERSLALKDDTRGWAWGSNGKGQLGNGENPPQDKNTPVPVVGRQGQQWLSATHIAAGGYHSLAISDGGRVLAWGDNASGQLGTGNSDWNPHPRPEEAQAINVRLIGAGDTHSLAVSVVGGVHAWGRNFSGQLGNDSTRDSAVPVLVGPWPD